jgi:hypothetical protein
MFMSGCVYVYNQLAHTAENEGKMVIDISQIKDLTFEGIFIYLTLRIEWLNNTCVKFT